MRNGAQLYALVYFGAIVLVAVLEALAPRRAARHAPGMRWLSNFGLAVMGAMLVRVVFPFASAGWAAFCQERGLGLFNSVAVPGWLAFAATVIVLDFEAYAQHYILHRVPMLWRVHRTHHSDLDYDFSTGVRFHPLEAIYSTAFFWTAILALGAPPVAVLISQALTIAADFVEHANLKIPSRLDGALRAIIVTPDMHRLHHSQNLREGNSNFSNVFSWWDRLFGTYVDQPAAGHDGLVFGVSALADPKHLTLPWMLSQPFLTARGEPAMPTADPSHSPEASR